MENQDLSQRVQKALDEIRPFLNKDGGDISLVEIQDDLVKVRLEGNCFSCGINQMTLRSGVELTIKRYAPEITRVVNVE